LENGGLTLARYPLPVSLAQLRDHDTLGHEKGEKLAIGSIARTAKHFLCADLGPAEHFVLKT